MALYLEPAPYIVGLVNELRQAWSGQVDVLYASKSLTQDWAHDFDRSGDAELPSHTLEALRAIRRHLASGRYGLLHLAGWGHPLLLGALMLGRAYGIPVAVESDTGTRSSTANWKQAAKRLLYPALFRLPSIFLPGGTRQIAYLTSYGVPAARIRMAQMTVDVAAFMAAKELIQDQDRRALRGRLGISDADIAFLYVGRLEPVKGIQFLLEGFMKLHARLAGIVLLVVGDGSVRDSLSAMGSRDGAIRFLGRRSGGSLLECYGAADAFVLPSVEEPWGLVVNEAMAFGLPIIATHAAGCADDLLCPGENALVVGPGSAAELADAMDAFAGDAQLRSAMGKASAQKISTWTLANEAANVCAAWNSVLVQ